MEKEVKVTPYAVVKICESCGEGEMFLIGDIKLSNPPKWEHKCEKCGASNYFEEKYPTVRYRRQ